MSRVVSRHLPRCFRGRRHQLRAGGGTLLTFPSLIWVGLPSTIANATSTVAIWPGLAGRDVGIPPRSGRRSEIELHADRSEPRGRHGGRRAHGADANRRLRSADSAADLFRDTALHAAGARAASHQDDGKTHAGSTNWLLGALVFQFLVAVYGGYFGAGIGILMLAAFGFMGVTDIHQMNGLKTFLALCINGVAAGYFIWNGMVSWPHTLVMAVGAIAGGVWGAGMARRIGPKGVRRIVIAVGFTMAFSLLFRL